LSDRHCTSSDAPPRRSCRKFDSIDRMSFTRLSTYRRCPAWFGYKYLSWHLDAKPSVLWVGKVVEKAFLSSLAFEPLATFDLKELEEGCRQRVKDVFDKLWEAAQKEFAADANALGAWAQDKDTYLQYTYQALRFHLHEVRCCMEGVHPRSGDKLGGVEAQEMHSAWQQSMPHFTALDAEPFAGQQAIDEGYFQGEPDLIYDWTGKRRIIDLKASAGQSVFSTETPLQMKCYAYLDYKTDKGLPEGLEIWFLGRPQPVIVKVPTLHELNDLDESIVALLERSGKWEKYASFSRVDFKPQPSQVKEQEAPAGAASAWCQYCPVAAACSLSGHQVLRGVVDTVYRQLPQGRVSEIQGVVVGIREQKEPQQAPSKITLASSKGFISIKDSGAVLPSFLEKGLKLGALVEITLLKNTIFDSGFQLMQTSAKSAMARVENLNEDQSIFRKF
jgi:hypothetical protein